MEVVRGLTQLPSRLALMSRSTTPHGSPRTIDGIRTRMTEVGRASGDCVYRFTTIALLYLDSN